MGVSAAGKSTVSRLLAGRLGVEYLDGDDLHPESNRAMMTAGVALTDRHRMPWLDLVGDALDARSSSGAVIACSALRRTYRDRIRSRVPTAVFVHLHGDDPLLCARAAGRRDHFMPAALLRSQLDALEVLAPDEVGVTIDVAPDPDTITLVAAEWLEARRT